MPIVVQSTDYLFDAVLVWDSLGGAIRPLRNTRVDVTDPVAGTPVTVTQGGQSRTWVTTDSTGHATFTASQNSVKLTGSRFSFTVSTTVVA